jgi:hypothetical protein
MSFNGILMMGWVSFTGIRTGNWLQAGVLSDGGWPALHGCRLVVRDPAVLLMIAVLVGSTVMSGVWNSILVLSKLAAAGRHWWR